MTSYHVETSSFAQINVGDFESALTHIKMRFYKEVENEVSEEEENTIDWDNFEEFSQEDISTFKATLYSCDGQYCPEDVMDARDQYHYNVYSIFKELFQRANRVIIFGKSKSQMTFDGADALQTYLSSTYFDISNDALVFPIHKDNTEARDAFFEGPWVEDGEPMGDYVFMTACQADC